MSNEKSGAPGIARRTLTRAALAAAAACAAAVALPALAAYPEKPIKVVIGFPAGGPLDQHARLLADKLQSVLGQPVVVDYKAGAGGTVGAQEVMKAPADGHTLMLANTGVMVINPALYSRLPYSTLKDFTPIARTAMQPLALLVNTGVPAKNLQEFMAYAKARPGQVTRSVSLPVRPSRSNIHFMLALVSQGPSENFSYDELLER